MDKKVQKLLNEQGWAIVSGSYLSKLSMETKWYTWIDFLGNDNYLLSAYYPIRLA